MKSNRRDFLKTTGLAGIAFATVPVFGKEAQYVLDEKDFFIEVSNNTEELKKSLDLHKNANFARKFYSNKSGIINPSAIGVFVFEGKNLVLLTMSKSFSKDMMSEEYYPFQNTCVNTLINDFIDVNNIKQASKKEISSILSSPAKTNLSERISGGSQEDINFYMDVLSNYYVA